MSMEAARRKGKIIGGVLCTMFIAFIVWGLFVVHPVAVRIFAASVVIAAWRSSMRKEGLW